MSETPEPKGKFNLSALAVRERAVTLFLICLIFALLYQRYVLRRDIEGAVTVMGGKR